MNTQIVDPPCYDGRWVRAGRGCGAAELPAAEGTGGRVKTNPKNTSTTHTSTEGSTC